MSADGDFVRTLDGVQEGLGQLWMDYDPEARGFGEGLPDWEAARDELRERLEALAPDEQQLVADANAEREASLWGCAPTLPADVEVQMDLICQ